MWQHWWRVPHRLTARFVQHLVRASLHRLTATTQSRHAKSGVADAVSADEPLTQHLHATICIGKLKLKNVH